MCNFDETCIPNARGYMRVQEQMRDCKSTLISDTRFNVFERNVFILFKGRFRDLSRDLL